MEGEGREERRKRAEGKRGARLGGGRRKGGKEERSWFGWREKGGRKGGRGQRGREELG